MLCIENLVGEVQPLRDRRLAIQADEPLKYQCDPIAVSGAAPLGCTTACRVLRGWSANRTASAPMSLKEFIEASKKLPSGFSIGHSGDGTTGHIGMLELGRAAGITFTSIPFKGNGEAKSALIGKHVDYVMMTTGEALEVGQPGTPLTGVALWANQRAANGVATAAEQGYKVLASSERGIGAPRRLPDDIAIKIQGASSKP